MGYTYDALKTYLPEMVELLIDCVRNPVFLDWEVNEQVKQHCGAIMHLPLIFMKLQIGGAYTCYILPHAASEGES
jgi:hypothetical protein